MRGNACQTHWVSSSFADHSLVGGLSISILISIYFDRLYECNRHVVETCSQVECFSELLLSQISLVIDLHLLGEVDLCLDAGLEVLKLELALHAGAGVWSVADEAGLAKGAGVSADGLVIEDDEAGVVSEHSVEFLKSRGSHTCLLYTSDAADE